MTTAVCTQPGCGGTIEDGFCTVCGLAPAPALAGTAAAGTAVAGGSGSAVAGGSGSASWSAGAGSRRGSRGSRPGSGRSSRGGLGAGLVEVPPVPARDPAAAVLADPRVPENRRFCGNCGQLVGQPRDGRPGLTEGFCPRCGTRFSFTPKLAPGELVAGQYEVIGCLAHGGLGWIYLARDRNVSDRWVVLKGLLNTGDPDALAAAVAERQFLAQVEHPNIVRIYNFVQHASRRDGESAGYIVMEYVGGKSLKQIRLEARQRGTTVPLAHALAYAIEILPALGYLHGQGLVYCDFKPDNVIQTEEQLKLIDMGGVRPIDGDGPVYGTVGYQAPEIETQGPSPASDLYTVGRTLAVLTLEFAGYQGEYRYRLPASAPLLAQQESFARLLRRATHTDPKRRFQSAGEMAEQATGVLREVLSLADGEPRPAFSGLFSPELRAIGTDLAPVRAAGGGPGVLVSPPPAAEVIAGLPVPLADGTDPAAGYLATLGGLEPAQQAAALRAAVCGDAGVPPAVAASPETRLALVRALIAVGDLDGAAVCLAELAAAGPADWRIAWHHGLRDLAAARPDSARAAFSAVYDELPGELAPKLALGFAAEAAGDMAAARRYYQLVWAIDRSYISAAFGSARSCLAGGDRLAAIAAVAAVPETSIHHAAAQIAAVRLLLAAGSGITAGDLSQAGSRLSRLPLDDLRRQQLTVEVLHAALDWVSAQPPDAAQHAARPGDGRILGCEPNERALRLGLERGYRALASLTADRARKVELVDMANAIRPRTWT
ncbi:MAG TPA: tetratricopeptide repeat protein [Trebonia sp.]|nr:tetratricopeptide repeat protein [Trebonia sp.]